MVLANSMSPQIHPSGFRISDKPVAASFAHPYSFQPVADYMLRDDTAIPSSLNLGGVENTFVKYWDESATVALLEFKVEEPTPSQAQAAAATKEKEKKKKAKGDILLNGRRIILLTTLKTDDASQRPPVPSALPVSDKPVTLNFKAGPSGNKPLVSLSGPKAPAPLSLGFSAEDFAAGDEETEQAHTAEDDKGLLMVIYALTTAQLTCSIVAAAKKVAPLIASKKVRVSATAHI